jgi:peptidoglycan/LPS O-acetylase OafA/YrhL
VLSASGGVPGPGQTNLRSRSRAISPVLTLDPTEAGPPLESPHPQTGTSTAESSGIPHRKPALPALTGLRTLLAVNIMFFHFTPPLPQFIRPVVDNAFTFVGCFFLISGFILAYNYADRPRLEKRKFYVARFSRVYPVYLLVLVLSIPFLFQEWQAHTHADFYTGLILTPLALQGWSPLLATFWNTVGWTLPAELMLYLAFPYILRFIQSHAEWLDTPLRLSALILGLWALGITPHIWYFLTNPDHLDAQANRYTYAYWLRVLKYTPIAYVCTFTAGIVLARLHALLALGPLRRGVLALTALAGLGLFFAFGAARIPYVLIHGSLLLPLFSLLLLGLAGSNVIASAFAWKPIVLLGETTFALYLVHFNAFLLIHFYKLPERLHVAQFDPWISYAFIMALAALITFKYERPARNFVLTRLSPAR